MAALPVDPVMLQHPWLDEPPPKVGKGFIDRVFGRVEWPDEQPQE